MSSAPTDQYSESQNSSHSILVHSPWLPGYINVAQTILIILTMAGLFLDRPSQVEFDSRNSGPRGHVKFTLGHNLNSGLLFVILLFSKV